MKLCKFALYFQTALQFGKKIFFPHVLQLALLISSEQNYRQKDSC